MYLGSNDLTLMNIGKFGPNKYYDAVQSRKKLSTKTKEHVEYSFQKADRNISHYKAYTTVQPGPGKYTVSRELGNSPEKKNAISINFSKASRFGMNTRKINNLAQMYSKFEYKAYCEGNRHKSAMDVMDTVKWKAI